LPKDGVRSHTTLLQLQTFSSSKLPPLQTPRVLDSAQWTQDALVATVNSSPKSYLLRVTQDNWQHIADPNPLERPPHVGVDGTHGRNMITYLPSPAPSVCDSLADIDDLDAFLEAQGQLTRWPTPPKEQILIMESETTCDDDGDESFQCELCGTIGIQSALTPTDHSISGIVAEVASIARPVTCEDVETVRQILFRAQLPPEVIAMAYNILSGLDIQHRSPRSLYSAPPDLMAASALTLAASYLNDKPPSFVYWSRTVCDRNWSASRIDKTALLIMAAHGWRLHSFSCPSAVQTALATFDRCSRSPVQLHYPPSREGRPSVL
jgi:hypothetical protein